MNKILFVLETFKVLGGAEKVVLLTARLFASKGYEVHVVSFDNSDEVLKLDFTGVLVSGLGRSATLPLFFRPATYFSQSARLRRYIIDNEIDISISNLWRADLLNILSMTKEKKISLIHTDIESSSQNKLILNLKFISTFIFKRFDFVLAVNPYLSEKTRLLFGLIPARCGYVFNFLWKSEGGGGKNKCKYATI